MEPSEPTSAITEIFYGPENAVLQGVKFMANTVSGMDLCYGKEAPSIVIEVDAYRNGYNDVRRRGGKIRVITEITRDNISYCKQLSKIVDELRHIDGIKGGMAVNESEYMATTTAFEEGKPLIQVLYSNSRVLVEQQRFVFDILWNNAIAAEEKFAEIEQGRELQVTKIVAGGELQQRIAGVIGSARNQLLVMLSDLDAFSSSRRCNLTEMLNKAADSVGTLEIRVLVPFPKDRLLREEVAKVAASNPGIDFSVMGEELQNKITMVVADKKRVVYGTLKGHSGEKVDASTTATIDYANAGEEIGIYSNDDSIASAYSLIIESLLDHVELYTKVRELNVLKEEFVNLAAHELRTPILPIILAAEELADEIKDDESKNKIAIIVRNANRLNKLTKDILDASRIESNTFKLQKEKTNIKKIVLNAIQDTTCKIANDQDVKITFESTLPEERQYVIIDKGRIYEVIVNLLDNAINFTDHGIVSVTIKENKQSEDNFIQVDVADTGKGIDGSIMSKLFQKFVTKSEKAKGTGLGLYLCKGIIESHGGKIWAKNNENGMGATFSFTLPRSTM
jgi:hypothetical protein